LNRSRAMPDSRRRPLLALLLSFGLHAGVCISISPPVPTVSIEFDAEMKLTDLRMPLDRRLYKRVRLLEVR
jgi:hypothetical protein